MPRMRSDIVRAFVPGKGNIKLDAGKYTPSLLRAANGPRRFIHQAVQMVAEEIASEIMGEELAFDLLDFDLGTIIESKVIPSDWVVTPSQLTLPGFVLNSSSPTAQVPSIRGLKTITTTIQRDGDQQRRWFGQPKEDPNPDFWDWFYSRDLPEFIDARRLAGPQYKRPLKGNLKRGTPATTYFTFPKPVNKLPERARNPSVVIETSPQMIGPPTIRQTHSRTRPPLGVNEGKSDRYSGAFNLLGAALDYTSEGLELWEILREHAHVPDHYSTERAVWYLMNGGLARLDENKMAFAVAVANNIIIDKIIGPILGSYGGYIRKRTGLSHIQIQVHI